MDPMQKAPTNHRSLETIRAQLIRVHQVERLRVLLLRPLVPIDWHHRP